MAEGGGGNCVGSDEAENEQGKELEKEIETLTKRCETVLEDAGIDGQGKKREKDTETLTKRRETVFKDAEIDGQGKELEKEIETLTKRCETVYKDAGIDGLYKLMSETLDAWERMPVNIAVVGNSGVGKSSFINTIRKLKPGDEGAAAVGSTETTKTVKHYAFPGHQNILVWDLPGVGTPEFKKTEYEEKINTIISKGYYVNGVDQIGSFDFYLILTADRFTENDVCFVEKIEKEYKKKYFFVRTKVQVSLDSEKYDRPNPRSEDDILESLSLDCKMSLEKAGFVIDNVYLIDNRIPEKFDFQALTEDIISETPSSKMDTLVFSFSNNTQTILMRKYEQLKKRIPWAAIGRLNFDVLEKEVTFYREQFGLTDEAIMSSAKKLDSSSVETFISKFNLKSCKQTVFSAYIEASEVIIESKIQSSNLDMFSIVSARHSPYLAMMCLLGSYANRYKRNCELLFTLLNMCADDAKTIHKALCNSVITRRKNGPLLAKKVLQPDVGFL